MLCCLGDARRLEIKLSQISTSPRNLIHVHNLLPGVQLPKDLRRLSKGALHPQDNAATGLLQGIIVQDSGNAQGRE